MQSDLLLIDRIRAGDAAAWEELIARFEGRLLAFVRGRTRDKSEAEDVVQETFVGLLVSLPNFDRRRPLEKYLFSIAAHKLTDLLRRQGRRPAISLAAARSSQSEGSAWEPAGKARPASTIARSAERRRIEQSAVAAAIGGQIDLWRQQGQWEKIKCCELLFLRGLANKEAAARLGISEQAVANHKFEFLARLKTRVRQPTEN